VRDGDDRLLVAAMPEDATIPGGYGAVRGTRRSEGGLDESSAQPDATFARLPRSVLASTLVAQRGDPLLEMVEVRQDLGRQKGAMRTKVADEGLPQRGQFRPYRASSAAAARRQLTALATWLERNGQADAAASMREGLEETLTVLKLGLPPALRRFFATTNCIENLIGTLRHVTRNIKRWRDGDMRRRWLGLGLLRAAERSRRIKRHHELGALVTALEAATAAERAA
jgi:hypothetical protein